MKTSPFLRALLVLFAPLALHAQTSTWKSSPTNNAFSTATNWVAGTVPAANDALVFSGTSIFNLNIAVPFSTSGITFSSSYPRYQMNGNGSTLSIGSGGITLDGTGTSTFSDSVDFNSSLPIALTANQTWTTTGTSGGNLFVYSNVSGAFALTKAGTGSLVLNGNNGFSGGLAINAGTVYLGQSNSAGSGTVSVGSSGALGSSNGGATIANAVSVASGATLGGSQNGGDSSLELTGTVTLGSATSTINLGGEVDFSGTLTGPANTTLTFHGTGTGVAALVGTVTNVDNMIADNAAIVFGKTTTLPALSLQASNGGYVSVADIGSTTPTVASLLGLITNKAAFNGTIGFDTGDQATSPHVYSENIDLTGFTSGNVRLGSATSAILTGTITPVAQSYDFAGPGNQGGALIVQSVLADHGGATSVTVSSPNATPGHGEMSLILQGANTFTGSLTVSQSAVILDSATALPSKNFSLGNYSYIGLTETATNYANFADLAAHALSGGYTSTSVLGLDSGSILAGLISGAGGGSVRTVTDTIDLSSFTSIYLGTGTGVTIGSGATVKAPSDGVLRLVNTGEQGGSLTIDAPLVLGNLTSLVAGFAGAKGTVVLTGNNTYTGGTSLQGGKLLVSNANALGAGAITVLTSPNASLNSTNSSAFNTLGASAGSVTLANNIAVTDYFQIGTGTFDNSGTLTVGTTTLTLSGTISNNGGNGQLNITGPTTLSGANTYSGGTYVRANTTVNSDSGLGTLWVDLGRSATLTFTSANPTIASLSDEGNFVSGGGTGNVVLGGSVSSLGINGTINNSFSGVISGTGGITKSNTGAQTFTGANTYTGVTTLTGGTLSVSAIGNGGVAGGIGAATNAATNLVFNGGGLLYTGSTASTDRNFTINTGKTAFINVSNGATSLTFTGASTATNGGLTKQGGGTLILGGTNLYTGVTTLSGGSLSVGTIGNGGVAGNLGAATNAASNLVFDGGTLLYTGSTASTDRNFTINTGKTAFINVSNGATSLTLSGAGTATNGGLTKQGGGTLILGGSNLFTGATTVNGGKLFVNGSLASATSVNTGATLGGTGTLGVLATINAGGHLAPGVTTGSLTFSNGLTLAATSILDFQLGTSSDRVFVTGGTLSGPASGLVTINLTNSGGFTAGTYTLFDFTGATPSSFDLADFTFGTGISGFSSSLSFSGSTLVLTATAVPEPSAYAALAGALALGLAGWRRRRLQVQFRSGS